MLFVNARQYQNGKYRLQRLYYTSCHNVFSNLVNNGFIYISKYVQ